MSNQQTDITWQSVRPMELLSAIWEPAAAGRLREAAAAHGAPSLRRILEAGPTVALDSPEPAKLLSCNTPDVLAAARATLGQ
jgi:molybdopterin-guanine dinucleotide biosynthesis protein A